jgi:hypothetical protein
LRKFINIVKIGRVSEKLKKPALFFIHYFRCYKTSLLFLAYPVVNTLIQYRPQGTKYLIHNTHVTFFRNLNVLFLLFEWGEEEGVYVAGDKSRAFHGGFSPRVFCQSSQWCQVFASFFRPQTILLIAFRLLFLVKG